MARARVARARVARAVAERAAARAAAATAVGRVAVAKEDRHTLTAVKEATVEMTTVPEMVEETTVEAAEAAGMDTFTPRVCGCARASATEGIGTQPLTIRWTRA